MPIVVAVCLQILCRLKTQALRQPFIISPQLVYTSVTIILLQSLDTHTRDHSRLLGANCLWSFLQGDKIDINIEILDAAHPVHMDVEKTFCKED